MLDINYTLFLQVIGYFVLFFILNTFLFRPLLRTLKEREDKIEGNLKRAASADKEVSEGLSSYEKKVKEATVRGYDEINRIKKEALETERKIKDEAAGEASREITELKARLRAGKEEALSGLKRDTEAIAKGMAEKLLDRRLAAWLFIILSLAVPAVLHAAGAEHGEGGGEHAGGNRDMLWKVINFAILAAGIVIVWKKVLKGLIHKRSEDIKKALEEAKAAKEAAGKKEAEYKEKLSLLEKRLKEIVEELKREGEAERKRILAEAEAAAKKIKEDAKAASAQELKKAKIEISREASELAVRMAGEILRKEIRPEDQERLLKSYLKDLRLN